jgi:hypothetical protein
MAGARKHGAHWQVLSVGNMAAGSASDLLSVSWIYDAFSPAGRGSAATTYTAPYDLTGMQVAEANLLTYTILTGQATNFASLRLTHTNAAGTVQNRIRVIFSAAGIVTAALVPMNFSVASGAVVTGAGTGILTVDTGVALPWNLVQGDVITLDRLSNNVTGLATPAFSATILIQQQSA